MAGFPPITVRQPRPHDLVDDPVAACGVGTGFEGVFQARVRDGTGAELVQINIHAGGMGTWGNYHAELPLGGAPSTPRGTLEVYEVSMADGSEVGKVVVPIVFGTALVNPYHGFAQYTVVSGDTLGSIADHWYMDETLWPRIFEANRNQIDHADWIFPGQVLRIPQ
jgi:nucleoid-associated protein YgaU